MFLQNVNATKTSGHKMLVSQNLVTNVSVSKICSQNVLATKHLVTKADHKMSTTSQNIWSQNVFVKKHLVTKYLRHKTYGHKISTSQNIWVHKMSGSQNIWSQNVYDLTRFRWQRARLDSSQCRPWTVLQIDYHLSLQQKTLSSWFSLQF